MCVCVVDVSLSLVPVDGKRRVSLSSQWIHLLLECGHSFCSLCLQKMAHLQSSDLPCPQCRVRREEQKEREREGGREGERKGGRETEGGREGEKGRDESLLCIHVHVHVLLII